MTMEEVTEWDTVVQCDHSYNRRCAKSMKTTYEAYQVGGPDVLLVTIMTSTQFGKIASIGVYVHTEATEQTATH